MKHRTAFLAAIAAALLAAVPVARAGVTISVGPHLSDPVSGKISPYAYSTNVFVETFDQPGGGCGLVGSPSAVSGGTWGIVRGTLAGAYAAPAGDTSCYGYAPTYNGIGQFPGSTTPPNLPPGVLSAVDISFQEFVDTLPAGKYLNYFGLYYGSIDNFNTLEFYSGNTKVATVTGDSVLAACGACRPGDQSSDATNAFVNLYFTEDVQFTRLRFLSSGQAVEVDNITAGFDIQAVPEPSSLLLAGAGLSALGWLGRRRRRHPSK